MEEKKVIKLKEQFKKTYLDTVKHENDIEKWIQSGKRKKGDIRRSIQRLETKYQKLCELVENLEDQKRKDGLSIPDSEIKKNKNLYKIKRELESKEIEEELTKNYGISLNQIKNKIDKLYISAKLKPSNNNIKQNIELVTDIPGNEKGLYYIEKRKIFQRRGHQERKVFNVKERFREKFYGIKDRIAKNNIEKLNNNEEKLKNEYEQYSLKNQRGFFMRRIDNIGLKFSNAKNNILHKFKNIKSRLENKRKNRDENKHKKVGRISALLMAGTLAMLGSTTVGESNSKPINNDKNDKTYVDTNKEENNFKKSLAIQALEETTNPSTEQETTIKIGESNEIWSTQVAKSNYTQQNNKPEESENVRNINNNQSNIKTDKTNNIIKENKKNADEVYVLRANELYTENSLGGGASGRVSKDTKVKIYNRALVKEDEQGNRVILNVTRPGQNWEDYCKENNLDYNKFINSIKNNSNIQEMVSLDSENGESSYGWVEFNTLEQIKTVEQRGEIDR